MTAANVVGHIVPHKRDQVLFWDSENNWQALCTPHHNATKQAEEQRGFHSGLDGGLWP